MQIKAWMADHVFVSIGIAVGLTVLFMVVARDTLKKFHLRLFQLATLSQIGIGIAALATGSGASATTYLSLGGAIIAAALLSHYAGTRMSIEQSGQLNVVKDDLARRDAELKNLKDNSAVRVVVEPLSARPAEKKT